MNRRKNVAQGFSSAFTAALKGCATLCLMILLALLPGRGEAQTPALQIPPGAQASLSFDAERATEAYLATVPPDKKARSDA